MFKKKEEKIIEEKEFCDIRVRYVSVSGERYFQNYDSLVKKCNYDDAYWYVLSGEDRLENFMSYYKSSTVTTTKDKEVNLLKSSIETYEIVKEERGIFGVEKITTTYFGFYKTVKFIIKYKKNHNGIVTHITEKESKNYEV